MPRDLIDLFLKDTALNMCKVMYFRKIKKK